ncbi:MAG: hypothetical protein C4539_01340 [Ignavibacteriales bacterium]|nr:MAG: hypothetical protein C4539_01340 [Ignavibacteriales bacterium]
MNSIDLITVIFAIIIIPSYALYLFQLRKENLKKEDDIEIKFEKLLAALKEYSKNHPDLASTLNKLGLL